MVLGGLAMPPAGAPLRRNPLYDGMHIRWPSARYQTEYGALATYPAEASGPLEAVAGSGPEVDALARRLARRRRGEPRAVAARRNLPEAERLRDRRRRELARHQRAHYDAVTITHNETSTGVTNDIAALTQVVREEAPDALVLVDAVSSLGGIPVAFDEWGIDVCLASVQKAIALPPGITVVAVSNQALARAKKHPYRGTYFDFVNYKEKADEDSVPSTPSIPHFYALAAELEHILRAEGLEARYERHRRMRAITHERAARFARVAGDIQHASATVTALAPVLPPETIRAEMKSRGYTLGGGYGQWKETTFRIGHMGDISIADLEAMLDALAEVTRG